MFTDVRDKQYLADAIKAFVLDHSTSKVTRDLLLRTIKDFESLQWIPLAFQDAYTAAAKGLKIDVTTSPITVSYKGKADDALLLIDALLRKYAELIRAEDMLLAMHAKLGKEYTADDAAVYLGISRSTFDKYATRRKEITGRKVGTSILYSQAELDRFKATYNPTYRASEN